MYKNILGYHLRWTGKATFGRLIIIKRLSPSVGSRANQAWKSHHPEYLGYGDGKEGESVGGEEGGEREAIFHNVYLNMTYLHKDRLWKVNSAQVAQSLPDPNVFLGETEPAE